MAGAVSYTLCHLACTFKHSPTFMSCERFCRAGTTPILIKTLREFGLKFWRPTNSENRSESCSEKRVFTQKKVVSAIPRVAPRMAFSLRERFFFFNVTWWFPGFWEVQSCSSWPCCWARGSRLWSTKWCWMPQTGLGPPWKWQLLRRGVLQLKKSIPRLLIAIAVRVDWERFWSAWSTVGQGVRDQLGPSWSQEGQLGPTWPSWSSFCCVLPS